jgi:hypothetical protein
MVAAWPPGRVVGHCLHAKITKQCASGLLDFLDCQ